jgi:hypothetical protein
MIETFDQSRFEQLNDPEGLICPLELPTPTDLEIFEWAYYRLKNTDDFYTKRCFGILYRTLNEEF